MNVYIFKFNLKTNLQRWINLVTYIELFLNFLSLLIPTWFNDLLCLLISQFCIALVNNVLASNLFTAFTIATPHKYKMWLCMLGLSKVLSEMVNQQDEDFVSYSVTGMRKNSVFFQFNFSLCDWYNK